MSDLRFRMALPCGHVMRASMVYWEVFAMERAGEKPVEFLRHRMRKHHRACRGRRRRLTARPRVAPLGERCA